MFTLRVTWVSAVLCTESLFPASVPVYCRSLLAVTVASSGTETAIPRRSSSWGSIHPSSSRTGQSPTSETLRGPSRPRCFAELSRTWLRMPRKVSCRAVSRVRLCRSQLMRRWLLPPAGWLQASHCCVITTAQLSLSARNVEIVAVLSTSNGYCVSLQRQQ